MNAIHYKTLDLFLRYTNNYEIVWMQAKQDLNWHIFERNMQQYGNVLKL
jgi:hypothetical protein